MLSNLSRKERLLIIALLVLVVVLFYYRFIHVGITEAREKAKTNVEQLQNEVNMAQARVARIKTMEQEMNSGEISKMGSYNSSKLETAFLHTVLGDAPDYSITFDTVTRDGNQIRRNFALRFTAPSYDAAKNIIKNLTEGEYRCKVGDVDCTIANDGRTTINAACTFYETMVGGVEDSALPADSSQKDNGSEG